MRALLGGAVITACVGCAGPRAVVPPTIPVLLSHRSITHDAGRGPRAVEPAKASASARPDELLLDASHFDPPLAAALRTYLRIELGPSAADKELVLSRVTVKIKSMAAASDGAGAAASVSYGAPPGSPPGAGLAGAIIASVVIEGVKSGSTASFVLVNIEGEFAGERFAGFAYGGYIPDAPDSIRKVVLDAFAQARDSLAARAQFNNGGTSREAAQK